MTHPLLMTETYEDRAHNAETRIASLESLLMDTHKALSYADIVEGKMTRDFLKLDKRMAALGLFPHRAK